MAHVSPAPEDRQRAPSKRSLAARQRIFDAAEKLFAINGYDGTSVRDIAAAAAVPAASVLFHGASKEALFEAVVQRRADEIRRVRLDALEAAASCDKDLSVEDVLRACLMPLVDKAFNGGEQWLAYIRLIAIVSSDERWRDLSRTCFDPTAGPFIDALARMFPGASRGAIAAAYVFAISSALSLCTAQWRIEALAAGRSAADAADLLIRYNAAGMQAVLAPGR
ncbi:MAG: TetR/AcrR family transcriptional regulator [Brucellaceae bacterium]|nr:TetR/AcrR family transcriptional regulator [Brucellaceae bacterium]